jgi:hypothetical protein
MPFDSLRARILFTVLALSLTAGLLLVFGLVIAQRMTGYA